ncbi:MAG: polysaccharide biosynthesis protein, partial [Epsilonproteobacteria bacterium]|nr:polysaccharide biosynthesis protein [Campylobacterota bacterium]
IIATTKNKEDDEIISLCENLEIKYFRGDEEDVLKRYYEAATHFKAEKEDIIVRATSDCPLIDQNILKKAIDLYSVYNCDYVSNTILRTYPRGLDVEVFGYKALKEAHEKAKESYEREHVTPWIIKNKKTAYLIDEHDNSQYRLTLDEEEDYKAIKEVYELLNCKTDFDYKTLIRTLKLFPYVSAINQNIQQKEYEYSL